MVSTPVTNEKVLVLGHLPVGALRRGRKGGPHAQQRLAPRGHRRGRPQRRSNARGRDSVRHCAHPADPTLHVHPIEPAMRLGR